MFSIDLSYHFFFHELPQLNIQKTKIMAPGPITSWEIDGETVADYFFGLQNHCRWWLPWNENMLTPWKKSSDQPRQHIKNRYITLPAMVCLVKAMVFSVVMYGCESWTIKKAAAATAADKSLQLCTTLCDPIDGSPPGSSSQRKLSSD